MSSNRHELERPNQRGPAPSPAPAHGHGQVHGPVLRYEHTDISLGEEGNCPKSATGASPTHRFTRTSSTKRFKLPNFDMSLGRLTPFGNDMAMIPPTALLSPSDTTAESPLPSPSSPGHFDFQAIPSTLTVPESESDSESQDQHFGRFHDNSITLSELWRDRSVPARHRFSDPQREGVGVEFRNIPQIKTTWDGNTHDSWGHDFLTPTLASAPEGFNFSKDEIAKLIKEIHCTSLDPTGPQNNRSPRDDNEPITPNALASAPYDSENSVNVLTKLTPRQLQHLNQMKIVQWYCCQCGKSYGNLHHFVVSCDTLPQMATTARRKSMSEADSNDESDIWSEIVDLLLEQTINRFDCVRCSHMMCPYCIKARLSDLINK